MFNLLKTAVLMAAITALFMAIGSVLGGRQGMMIALVVDVNSSFQQMFGGDSGPLPQAYEDLKEFMNLVSGY